MLPCERLPPALQCAENYPYIIASRTVDEDTTITAWEDSPMERQSLMIMGGTTKSRDLTETIDECVDGCAVVGIYDKLTNRWKSRYLYSNMRGILQVQSDMSTRLTALLFHREMDNG